MFKVRAKQCATCIYRPASPLNITHLERQIADPHQAGFFKGHRVCHDTPGHPQRGPSAVCCRGFWNRHKHHFTIGQLAQRLRLVRFIKF